MRTLLIVAVLLVGGKFAYDRMTRDKPTTLTTDAKMQIAVADLNRKLPISNDMLQLERAEYTDGTLVYHGRLLTARPIDDKLKAELQRNVTKAYCAEKAVRESKIAVAYEIRGIAMGGLGDRVRDQSWRTAVQASDC